jgi:hypothetical protein
MKPVPLKENAYAFEKRTILIAVNNEDFSFHHKRKIPAKVITSKFFGEAGVDPKTTENEIEANDPGWYSSYE